MGHVDQPGDIGVDHRFPVVQIHFLRGLRRQRQPGVVNQRRDIGEFSGQRRHGPGDRIAIADVEFDNVHRHLRGELIL